MTQNATLERALQSVPGLSLDQEIAVRTKFSQQGLPTALGMLAVFKAAAPEVEIPGEVDDALLAARDRLGGDWDAVIAAIGQIGPSVVSTGVHARKLTDQGADVLPTKAKSVYESLATGRPTPTTKAARSADAFAAFAGADHTKEGQNQ